MIRKPAPRLRYRLSVGSEARAFPRKLCNEGILHAESSISVEVRALRIKDVGDQGFKPAASNLEMDVGGTVGMTSGCFQHVSYGPVIGNGVVAGHDRPKIETAICISRKGRAQDCSIEISMLDVVVPVRIGLQDFNLRPRDGPSVNRRHSPTDE